MKKSIFIFVVLLSVYLKANAHKPTGIHSSELLFDCEGEAIITSVSEVGKTHGFTDRADNEHPAHGYAYLVQKLQNLSSGCVILQNKYSINVEQLKLNNIYISFETTDLDQVQILAQKEIGKVTKFKVKQSFGYQEISGYLPFFPLLHSETLNIAGQYIYVDVSKVYNIYLYEDDKVQLSHMIFNYLDTYGTNANLSSQLISVVAQNAPTFQTNFKLFLTKLLALFDKVENENIYLENGKSKEVFNFKLLDLAADINKLTHKYPQYYEFNFEELILNHPSLLLGYGDQNFPNINSQKLDLVITKLEDALQNKTINPNIKNGFLQPIKIMMGSYGSDGSSLYKMTSSYASQKTKLIYQTYYKKN